MKPVVDRLLHLTDQESVRGYIALTLYLSLFLSTVSFAFSILSLSHNHSLILSRSMWLYHSITISSSLSLSSGLFNTVIALGASEAEIPLKASPHLFLLSLLTSKAQTEC